MEVTTKNCLVHIFNSSVVSGPETLVLPALSKLQIPVHVFFLVEDRLPESGLEPVRFAQSFGLSVKALRVRSRFDLRAIYELRDCLKDLDCKIIHSHDVKASTYAAWASLDLRIAKITTHHGIHGRPDWKSKLYEIFYTRTILRFYQAVIAVSTADYGELRRRGCPASKLHLIFNGITKNKITPEERAANQAEVRTRWFASTTPTQDILIGVVGRLSEEKDCARILRVIQLAQEQWPGPWRVLFFGNGRQEKQLKDLAQSLGIEERVRWMGYSTTIKNEMVGLDGLLCLSKAEGLPISFLEAGWSATPIFSTKVGGIKDLIPSPTFGTTVAPDAPDRQIASDFLAFLKNAPARTQMAHHLQQRIELEFAESGWLEKHQQLYKRFLPLFPQATDRHWSLLGKMKKIFGIVGLVFSLVACATVDKTPNESPGDGAPLVVDPTARSGSVMENSGVRAGYRFRLGCAEDKALNGLFRVDFNGDLFLPYNTVIHAEGLSLALLEDAVEKAFKPYFKGKPSVQIALLERTLWVEVKGLVNKPGKYLVRADTSLDEVIGQAGGPSRETPPKFLRIISPSGSESIDLDNYYRTGESGRQAPWQGREQIFLQTSAGSNFGIAAHESSTLRILGEVKKPGYIGYRPGANFLYYLAEAGGPTPNMDPRKIQVYRENASSAAVEEFSIDKQSTFPTLKSGDTVIVYADRPSLLERFIQSGSGIATIISTVALIIITGRK